MRPIKAAILFVLLSILLFKASALGQKVVAQAAVLQGPILVSEHIDGRITFQDVGANHVWGLDPANIITLRSWSPNGCELLVWHDDEQWALLSITDLVIRELPIPNFPPIWSPDGTSITLSSYEDGQRSVYVLNARDYSVQDLFSVEGPGYVIQWLSETELLYSDDGYWMLWDTTTQQSRPFGTEQFPRYGIPLGQSSIVHRTSASPNQEMWARYYSMIEYDIIHSMVGIADDEDLTSAEDAPRVPGFDLYFLNEGTRRHVDVHGLFLQSLEWSPSSQQIVVSTFYDSPSDLGGIYIYNIGDETLQRVDDFVPMYAAEYGPYVPTWSPDEEWLALRTQTGPAIYHLSSGRQIELDGRMNALRLMWSPVMDYSASQCASLE